MCLKDSSGARAVECIPCPGDVEVLRYFCAFVFSALRFQMHENMRRAQTRNAVLDQKFYFRKDVHTGGCGRRHCQSAGRGVGSGWDSGDGVGGEVGGMGSRWDSGMGSGWDSGDGDGVGKRGRRV